MCSPTHGCGCMADGGDAMAAFLSLRRGTRDRGYYQLTVTDNSRIPGVILAEERDEEEGGCRAQEDVPLCPIAVHSIEENAPCSRAKRRTTNSNGIWNMKENEDLRVSPHI